jgi:hypothetical protein
LYRSHCCLQIGFGVRVPFGGMRAALVRSLLGCGD